MTCDVLVVGAGPAGLAMASELARYGLAVRIIDKAPQRTDKSKALVIWSRTLELIDRMGCADAFLDAGLKTHAVNLVAGTKDLARITFDHVASPHPYALMIPQSDTERLLEEHLKTLGVAVERGVEMLQIAAGATSVTATLRHSDGAEETVESAWLAGCDGAHSAVRHSLGLEFEGKTLTSDWILADIHMSGLPSPSEMHMFLHTEGPLAIFPMSDVRFRIIAGIGEATGQPRPDPTMEEVQGIMDRRGPGGVTLSEPKWLASFRINERKVKDYRSGRVFLAGDAAHIHSPAGGQGMNTGIQDACNLAWKLALAQRGRAAPEPLLSSYNAERSPVAAEVLK